MNGLIPGSLYTLHIAAVLTVDRRLRAILLCYATQCFRLEANVSFLGWAGRMEVLQLKPVEALSRTGSVLLVAGCHLVYFSGGVSSQSVGPPWVAITASCRRVPSFQGPQRSISRLRVELGPQRPTSPRAAKESRQHPAGGGGKSWRMLSTFLSL